MRDPDRIDNIISVIKEIWELHPDMRFNQLINILQIAYCGQTGDGWNGGFVDCFYVEDDAFLEFLKEYLGVLRYRLADGSM